MRLWRALHFWRDVSLLGPTWEVPVSADEFGALDALLARTYKNVWTRDRGKGVPVPAGYELASAMRNENTRIWRKCAGKQPGVTKPLLSYPTEAESAI